ncbi:MAG: hypothetical protein JW820_17765, partial [Spirochaetales bacterium]|nr:hypothetical protein [Spirochaetales bacterium]
KGYLRRGAHLHLASLFLQRRLRASVPGLLARAKRAGMTTSLDPGHDPEGLWELGELGAGLAYLDWLLPNASEACGLAGVGELQGALGRLGNRMRDARREARRDARRDARRNTRGAPRTHGTPGDARAAGGAPFGIVAKEGSAGAWLWQDGGISHSPATRVAAPLDPACAGDCFDAGFLHALCGGSTPEQAVAAGNRLGALAVSFLGLPPREQLRKGGLAGAAGRDS